MSRFIRFAIFSLSILLISTIFLFKPETGLAANACDPTVSCEDRCSAANSNGSDSCIFVREGCLMGCQNQCDSKEKGTCEETCFSEENKCHNDNLKDYDNCMCACSDSCDPTPTPTPVATRSPSTSSSSKSRR